MELLARGATNLGIRLTREQLEQFQVYCDELIAWNERMNLTAISERDQIQVKHFLDSISLLRAWHRADRSKVLDVGSGAGFPGLPLKIVCPGLQLTLLEATAKKVRFLEYIIALLGLQQVVVIHGRAEEVGQESTHREMYDLVLARAVAMLPELVEYGLPFAKLGGLMIAHKGSTAVQEAHEAAYALSILGGELSRVVTIELPGIPEERTLMVIRKTALTPAAYPRRAGIPHKRPLGVKSPPAAVDADQA